MSRLRIIREWTEPRRLLILSLSVLLLTIDWYVPAGIAVGLLLMLPLIGTAFFDDRSTRHLLFLCLLVKLAEQLFGPEPRAEDVIWITNRVLVVTSWLASWGLASALRQLRLEAEAQRNNAMASSHLNRLLVSLVAHDFRSPLALVGQTLDYTTAALDRGDAPDRDLLGDVRRRIQRSIEDSERLVHLVSSEMSRGVGGSAMHAVALREHLEREVHAFSAEARAAGKRLTTVVDLDDSSYAIDTVVLRHLLGVLIENAIVHAGPGVITFDAGVQQDMLVCVVTDPGPGPGTDSARPGAGTGMGEGLRLAHQIAGRYGGGISTSFAGGGSVHRLVLPVTRVSTPA